MQVMPATGKDLAVGDIRQTEANIHAGVKYVRWMIDRYYADEPMTPLDKALFAFASYNAGPRRVTELRSEAARRGLDPNVWFHNVEYVAAERIGAETVTYVSNIYKYYVAYRLIVEAREEKERARRGIGGR
jgi:membrane-bound lytic murein transglycosylase MltF